MGELENVVGRVAIHMKGVAHTRFALAPGQWLAMEAWMRGFPDPPHCSPVRVLAVSPHGGGRRELTLRFFHATYPEGVREKEYHLRVLHRAHDTLTLLRLDAPDMEMTLTLFPLHSHWMEKHFPNPAEGSEPGSIERMLERRFGFTDL